MPFASENVEEVQVKVSPPGVERDASFYFDDDLMVVFLVENRLFRVHRRYFIKLSQVFRDMFSTANTNNEGEADEKPISLPGVTRHEFQTLLKFLYSLPPGVLSADPIVFTETNRLTLEEKLSLLSISHRLLFDDIFHFIIKRVLPSSIPVVERIRLGDRYHLVEWLSSARAAILDRSPGDLSAEEAESLGTKRVASIYKAKCSMYQECLKKASQQHQTNEGLKVDKKTKGPDGKTPSTLMWWVTLALAYWLTVFLLKPNVK